MTGQSKASSAASAKEVESLKARLGTVQSKADSAASAADVGSLKTRLDTVQSKADSAASAEEVASLKEQTKLLEGRLNALSVNLGNVTFRLDYRECKYNINDSDSHYCHAQCLNHETLLSGGCLLPNDEGGLIASSWLDNGYKTWHCMYYDIQRINSRFGPLTKTGAFAYCANPASAQAQCNPDPNSPENERIGCLDNANIATETRLLNNYSSEYLNYLDNKCQTEHAGGDSGGHRDRAECLRDALQDAAAKVEAQNK